jgi:tetratricopeptide (TPR) repeat protein
VFSRRPGPILLLTAILTISLGACARKETRGVERLAVLPLENLSADPSLDWAGPAVTAALVYDLASAPNLFAQSVGSMGDAESIRASHILQGYFVARNGRVEIRATLIDPRKTTTVASFALNGPLAAGPLPLANQLAKRLSGAARPFSTSNTGAFREYGIALSTLDRASALRGFESAVASDPNFTAASLASARLLLETGDRDGARKILETALSTHPDPIDQARLEYVAVTAAGDMAARLKALQRTGRCLGS